MNSQRDIFNTQLSSLLFGWLEDSTSEANHNMFKMLELTWSTKRVLILVLVIAVISAVDSQFIKLSYGTVLGRPDNYHLLLFVSLTVAISAINTILLLYTKSNDILVVGSRRLPMKSIYLGITVTQYTMSFTLFLMTLQMILFSGYNKTFSLIIVWLSHFSSATILGFLSLIFLQWFSSVRSISVMIYGAVFIAILFLVLITVGFLTEQVYLQPPIIYPRLYTSVILDVLTPSPNISFVQQLSKYVFPILVLSSWVITVSLLRLYANRIGKAKFWVIVSIPLIYQNFAIILSDVNIVTDPWFTKIVYSKEFQLLFGISNQISGLFFGMAFWIVGRKIKGKQMKYYLMISCIGIVSLFCSMPQTLALYAAYPPFGLVTFIFLGLSSYLLLVGIVGGARYISRDSVFRRELYKGLDFNSKILKNMAMAEIQREIHSKVVPLLQKIESQERIKDHLDLEEDKEDIKMIIDDVIKEIHSKDSSVEHDRNHL